MPVYEYACKACGEHLEVSQSFKDEPLTTCPVCGGPLRKVFNSIGIVLKGSGFYRTDSRTPTPKPASRDNDGSGEKADKGDKSDKGDKADKRDKADKKSGDGAKADSGKASTKSESSGGGSEKAAKSSGASTKSA